MVLGLAAAALLGALWAVASYAGWLPDDDLERARREAQRARDQYARELDDEERAWAAERGDETEIAPASTASSRPLSTLSCKEAHRRYASEAGKPDIDPDLARRVKRRLSYGTYLDDCHVPDTTAVFICATIVGGVAEGVTVRLTPDDRRQTACIDEAVRRMAFPIGEDAVVATTRFR